MRRSWRQSRLERLLKRIREINEATRLEVTRDFTSRLAEIATAENAFTLDALERSTEFAFEFNKPSVAQIRAAAVSRPFQGAHLRWATTSEHLREQYRRRGGMLREEIKRAVVEGDSVDQVIRRIRGTKAARFKDGILDISRRGAETIARTSINHVGNAAREATFEENAEHLDGLRWTAILDGRTSAICRARDGRVAPIGGKPVPSGFKKLSPPSARPPAHPNCRSLMQPIFEGEEPAEEFTYGEWLKRQPAMFQDEVLGRAKGRLFRAGGLTLDKFVDRKGREFSLAELRVKEMEAFEKAGLIN